MQSININNRGLETNYRGTEQEVDPLATDASSTSVGPNEQLAVEESQPENALEDTLYKRRVIMSIQRYIATFPKKLGTFTKYSDYENMEVEELEKLLHEMKFTISCANSINNIPMMFTMGCSVFEAVACDKTPFKLKGLTGALIGDETFMDTLKEVALENEQFMYSDPLTRLGMKIGMTALGLHYMNSQVPSVPSQPEVKVQEKFADL